jgi:hypothetical protein
MFRTSVRLRSAIILTAAVAAAAPVSALAGRRICIPSQEAQTISQGFLRARQGDTVMVSDGVYRERVVVEPGVTLMAKTQYGAIIDGKGRGTVVTMEKNSAVSGFEIRNGTIGVFCKSPGSSVSHCRIVKNWQTGIICVRFMPTVEDNVIAFNRASGFQGWDLRGGGVAAVRYNTIAFNGNHGVAVGGQSSFAIEKNVIAHNERFGIKMLPDVEKMVVTGNDVYGNLWSPTPLPERNYTYDPKFADPRNGFDFTITAKVDCPDCPQGEEMPGVRLQGVGSSIGGGLF